MIKLTEKVKTGTMTAEEKANLVLSLIRLADSGKKFPGTFENYLVDDKGDVCFLDAESDKYILASPEYFTPADVDLRDKSMFTVGLLTYYIYNGALYYDVAGVAPLELYELAERGAESLIDNENGELSGAYAGFTSFQPDKRYNGVEAFFKYVKANFKGSYTVNYRCDGATVKTEKGELAGDIEKYPEADTVEADGSKYKINKKFYIPYRVGNTEYTVNVTRIKTPAPAPVPPRRPVERPVPPRPVDIPGERPGENHTALPDRTPREPRVTTQTTGNGNTSNRLPNRAEDVQTETTTYQHTQTRKPPVRKPQDNPQKARIVNGKVQGVAEDMNLPEDITNYAYIGFVCDGRLVFKTNARNFKKDIIDYPFGKWITANDGSEYIALATADICNRTGAYKYIIPVKKAKGKIETYIMLSMGDNKYEKLVVVGKHESFSFNCYADKNGLNAPIVGGYVDSGSEEVIYLGPLKIKLSLPKEKQVRVSIHSFEGENSIMVDVVEVESGRVLIDGMRIAMPNKVR